MKKTLLGLCLLVSGALAAQQNYDDFEGNSFQDFGFRTGMLDSMRANPMMGGVNVSNTVAMYRRNDTVLYDVLTMYPVRKMVDVTPYATNAGTPPRFRMKVYSTAPVGTIIDLQIGSKADNMYPSGIHSQYQAVTTMQNAWEDLTFTFTMVPAGSMVNPYYVDKMVLLFAGNTMTNDTFYIDDLNGPEMLGVGIEENKPVVSLLKSSPNPASTAADITFNLSHSGFVSLKIYDMLGNEVKNVVSQNLSKGDHRIRVDVSSLHQGAYFYALETEAGRQTKRMLVTR